MLTGFSGELISPELMAIWAVILSQPINKKATRDPVMALLNEIIIFKGSSQ